MAGSPSIRKTAIAIHCIITRIQIFILYTTPPPMKSIGAVPLLKRVKYKISARPHAGLFFCLVSAEGAGLLFCPAAICLNSSVYSAFCVVNAITANATKQRTGLYSGFSCDCTHSIAANTRPAQTAIIPPVPRWSVS